MKIMLFKINPVLKNLTLVRQMSFRRIFTPFLVLTLLIAITHPVLARNNTKTQRCESLFSNSIEIINVNARLAPSSYIRPHFRTLDSYLNLMGSVFQKSVDQLQPGETIIDSGGGYGLASLKLVHDKGARAFVINAQNFWTHFTQTPAVVNTNQIIKIVEEFSISLKDIPVVYKTGVSASGKFKYAEWNKLTARHYEILKDRIFKYFNKHIQKDLFLYIESFTEVALKNTQENAKIIVDVFGAFTYSAQRHYLLDAFYNNLASNGKAFIKIRPQKFTRIEDQVLLGKNRKMAFIDYLLEQFPQVFSIDPVDKSVLVMQKDPNITDLNLTNLLRLESHTMIELNETSYPEVIWTLKR